MKNDQSIHQQCPADVLELHYSGGTKAPCLDTHFKDLMTKGTYNTDSNGSQM